MIRSIALVCLACSLAACGDLDDPSAADSSSSESTGSTGTTSTASTSTTSASTAEPTTGEPTTTDSLTSTGDETTAEHTTDIASTTAVTTSDGTTFDTTSTGDTTDDTTGDAPIEPELPASSMPCPQLIDGTIEIHPDGVASPRAVRIWMDPELVDELDGSVVFYWHGTGGKPDEALTGLGELGIQEILDAGGIVVAPSSDPGAGVFPWHLVLSDKPDDLRVADEVLACAQAQFGVDAGRVHSLGFSAGGLHTAQMSIRRSSYIASVAMYSGGLLSGSMPAFELPSNDFPAMLFHGGAGDVVVVGFKQASEDYVKYMEANDNFAFICDHGGGHTIPDAQDSVMEFLLEHPYGVTPEPYVNGLPDGFPDYCALP